MKNEKEGKPNEGSRPSSKKPYRRPEILYREKLEVMAAVCAPAPPAKANPGQCPSGPMSS